ncbi:MAG: oxalurate catabolism protein HpxZ [Pseudomonadota bacterium]
MNINRPNVVAEVTEAFNAYEAALVGNDVDTLDRLFWASPEVVRYGPREALYGRDEILAFRKARPSAGLDRTLVRTLITTFGTDFGTAFTEFRRPGMDRTGRQSQSWARFPEGWRIVAAHVSFEEA